VTPAGAQVDRTRVDRMCHGMSEFDPAAPERVLWNAGRKVGAKRTLNPVRFGRFASFSIYMGGYPRIQGNVRFFPPDTCRSYLHDAAGFVEPEPLQRMLMLWLVSRLSPVVSTSKATPTRQLPSGGPSWNLVSGASRRNTR
jgi:hypothetical protein